MSSRFSQALLRIVFAAAAVSATALAAAGQSDPDPNSPTPVLLTEVESNRALAHTGKIDRKRDIAALRPDAFEPNSKVTLYVANLDLLKDEGANAFRVYGTDRGGRHYSFPVVEFAAYPNAAGLHSITVMLKDQIGYWPEPPAGDLYVYLTWRGLVSNKVRVGYGATGGLPDLPNAKPAPLTIKSGRVVAPRMSGEAPEYVGYRWSGDRKRFLEQATFGPTFALDERIRRIGIRTWLAEQFEAPYPSLTNPYPNHPLKSVNIDDVAAGCGAFLPSSNLTYQVCARDHYTMYPIQAWNTKEMLYGDAQLRHRVAWTLNQIWVTSGVDVQQSRHMVEYHKVLSANAFGNYRDLMEQITLHPTMGTYLDMAISTRNNPNENYAREIMQLFSIGLFMLNQDGTYQLDGNNNPIPTYDQNGVNNLTKVLTGWRDCRAAGPTCPNLASGTVNYIDPMVVNIGVNQGNINNNLHDLTAKTLLDYPGADPADRNIAACTNCTTFANIATYANNSMDSALDNLFNHPNVGPYIGKIMIQHLVTSNPTPAYVSRVAGVFNNNGSGVRGDMKAVVRAILLDPEARGDLKTDPNYGKLREPMQLATNYLRAFNVRNAAGTGLSDGVIHERGEFIGMAQVPFRSPTVFNYYPPDYVIPGTVLLGPEFMLMTTGTSIARANFMNRFVFTAPAIAGGTTNTPEGTSVSFSDLEALAAADTTGNLLVDELNRRMLYGTMTPAMKASILPVVTSVTLSTPPTQAQLLNRARQAVYLVSTSTQYQVQR